jgi:hypothetical protein
MRHWINLTNFFDFLQYTAYMDSNICHRCRTLLNKAVVFCGTCGVAVTAFAQPGAPTTHLWHATSAPAIYALTTDRPDSPHDPVPDVGGPPPSAVCSATVATTTITPSRHIDGGAAPTT